MFERLNRRQFLKFGGQTTAGLALLNHHPLQANLDENQAPTPGNNIVNNADLIDASVQTLTQGIRAKKFSSVELVQAYLNRIEEVNPWLNAVVRTTAESAILQARNADAMLMQGKVLGPLHGIPMTVKDSLNTAGVTTTWSVKARSDFIPDTDATVVARLKSAGAILLGKTNTPELTLSFETNSPVFGPTNNPYGFDRTAGGSSGGAAAIVAASGAAFDIGSDTGGSVRVPCHCCGVTGIRPTSGRVPRSGNAIGPGGLLDSLTTIGPIARYVEDLKLILPLISGPDALDPAIVPMPKTTLAGMSLQGMRGTFYTDNGIRSPDKETAAAVQSVVSVLSQAGVQFDEARPPGIEQTLDLFVELMNWDKGLKWRQMIEQPGGGVYSQSSRDENLSAKRVIHMIDQWDRFRASMLAFMNPFDLLISPTNALPAMPHGQSQDNLDAFSYTMTYSLTGWPSAVVRAATSPDGLPIGIQVVAKPWREDVVLLAAAHIEHELGGWESPSL